MINPEDLSKSKLQLISIGSVGGMGLAFLGSLLINTPLYRLIIAILLLTYAGWAVYKIRHYLVIHD